MLEKMLSTKNNDSEETVQPPKPSRAPSRAGQGHWLSHVGNQAVQRVVGRGGWSEGTSGDKREDEARSVAEEAVHQVDAKTFMRPGNPLQRENSRGKSVRHWIEQRFQTDLGDVRLHTHSRAADSARAVNALAYTADRDIVFASGQYNPNTPAGLRLLAHELVHVSQNRSKPESERNVISRQEASQGGLSNTADADAQAAGPCGVVEGILSNQGLLFQLNRARVYLTQHARGEGEWYDYANLLRRLSTERRHRVGGGQIWLAESGLLEVPNELYALTPGAGLEITVSRIPGTTVRGAYRSGVTSYMTRGQFERFLSNNNIHEMNFDEMFSSQQPGQPPTSRLTLPLPEQRSRYVLNDMSMSSGIFVRTNGRPLASPFLSQNFPFWGNASGQGGGPIGFNPFGQQSPNSYDWGFPAPLHLGGSMPLPWDSWRRQPYTPGAGELIGDVRSSPGSVTRTGRERVFLPAASSTSHGVGPNPFIMQTESTYDYPGVSAFGFLGRPGIGMPNGTTGILWEGSHVIDFAVLNDRMFTRGFRAPGTLHTADFLTPRTWRPRAQLNVGTPGSYANDALFAYGGELWGRGPLSSGHWQGGSVAIVRADGSPLAAEQLMELMMSSAPGMQGLEYRYSPPPEGTAAYAAADREARRRGMVRFCSTGGQNCINVPEQIHRTALGGVDLRIQRPDGTMIDLSDPANASARTMSEFMNQPDRFFEERGLRRVRIGSRAGTGLIMAGGLGAGMSAGIDVWRAASGEDVSFREAAGRAAIGGGTSAVSVIAEDFAYTSLTSRLVSSGMTAGSASTLGRVGASTGIGVVAAPIATGLEMAWSDEEFTRIDYTARMSRSGVAAGGGALATGLFFAAAGSEVPVLGNIAGFLIGVGGYYLTDWLVGDDVEETVREGMGEYGCTDGVGPGR